MSTHTCPNCGSPNAPQARFCARCGAKLPSGPLAGPGIAPSTCPRCSAAVLPGQSFCPNCGHHMVQGAPAPAGGAPPPGPANPAPPAGGPAATQLLGSAHGQTTLLIRYLGGITQRAPISKPETSVGRAGDNDIPIDHPAVSGHHLRLINQAGVLSVIDVGSRNGTLINNQMIERNRPYPFMPSDVIRLGDLTGNSVSIVQEGEYGLSMRTLSLGKLDLANIPSISIGRDTSCYLPLNHPSVSFHHATIFKLNGGLAIRDMGSTNGTFVNSQRIAQAPLNSGDTIQIGPFRLVYDAQAQSLAQSQVRGHRLDAIQISRQVADKRWILRDVTLSVQPGDFIALVGGSGAGKSTLMMAMNGYNRATHGQMLIDGEELYPQLALYRSQMGYVPQDDIIHRELPVRLALWYAAKLRLPDFRSADIETRIDEVLKSVEMSEHQDKRVAKLSGGQRKRVSIAVELLASPTLFYLDEPTSGLDPGLEKKMMYDLNRLADEGRTVVLVTHATANIEQCDFVAFMTWGRLAYYGPPKDALNFFSVRDFSDIYQELGRELDPAKKENPPKQIAPYYQQKVQQQAAAPVAASQSKKGGGLSSRIKAGPLWADAFSHSPDYQKYVTDRQRSLQVGGPGGPGTSKPPRVHDSFFRQTWLLARRQFDLTRMDIRTLFILLLMMPFIAMLFVVVTKDDALIGRGDKSIESIEADLREQALKEYEKYPNGYKEDDPDRDWSAEYKPYADAKILLVMLGLALTQAGTFGAAYEIVKERAIFKRERAVNLSVVAYVLSKVLVLALFAIIQVASVVLIMALRVKMNYQTILFEDAFWAGMLELFIIMYLGVLASIGFGLLISAIVPSTDVVLYAILAQLFVQIVLSATLFPLPANPLSMVTPGYWTMNALASSIDLKGMDDEAMKCLLTQDMVDAAELQGKEVSEMIDCPSASARETNVKNYIHEVDHLYTALAALALQFVGFVLLTIVVQARKKID
jgi:ABC transport system ATP-binding/permease protein